ncbi:MAG: hypothetical protein SF028_04670 [Candidatus Sumerlaeia bacterium]|nr:hypothetical protein [Candidatus Sumerlaeia bacterium]
MFDQMTTKELITLLAYFAVAFVGIVTVPYVVWRLDQSDHAEETDEEEGGAAPH